MFRKTLTIALLTLVCLLTVGASVNRTAAATPLPDGIADENVGGTWRQFLAGVTCGTGIVLMASGYVSGLAAVPAALLTYGVLQSCATALDM